MFTVTRHPHFNTARGWLSPLCTVHDGVIGLAFVQKVGNRKLQFCDKQLQISVKDIMGAQNFNFTLNSPKIGGFPAHILYRYFWKKISDKKKMFTGLRAYLGL